MSLSVQYSENCPANSRPLSTQIFSGFRGIAQFVEQSLGFKVFDLLFPLVLRLLIMDWRAFLHSMADFRLNGIAQTNRLRVSTAARMKFTPWLSCQLLHVCQVNGPNLIQPVALNFQSEKTIARLFKLGISLAAVKIVVNLFECAFGSLFESS